MHSPKLIVFDLDFTLWDCGGTWCDCLSPPFTLKGKTVVDSVGHSVQMYPDVPTILDDCEGRGLAIALASRTEEPDWARELLGMLGLSTRFDYSEIYPSSKRRHFAALQKNSGFSYADMLFFDDEQRNIAECSKLGVRCVFVRHGISRELFQNALNSS